MSKREKDIVIQLQEQLDSGELKNQFEINLEKFSDIATTNPFKLLIVTLLLAGFGVLLFAVLGVSLVLSTITWPFRMLGRVGTWLLKKFN